MEKDIWDGSVWYENVKLENAKYAVFSDFDPEPYILGFVELEHAKKYLEERTEEMPGGMENFLVEIIDRKVSKAGE